MVLASQVLGSIYTTGNVSIYIASYLRAHSDVTLKEINLLLPVQTVCSIFTVYIGAHLCIKYNAYV